MPIPIAPSPVAFYAAGLWGSGFIVCENQRSGAFVAVVWYIPRTYGSSERAQGVRLGAVNNRIRPFKQFVYEPFCASALIVLLSSTGTI